jgi:hypothetical protein
MLILLMRRISSFSRIFTLWTFILKASKQVVKSFTLLPTKEKENQGRGKEKKTEVRERKGKRGKKGRER